MAAACNRGWKPTVSGIRKIVSHDSGGRKLKSPIAAATIVAHVAPDSFSAGSRPQLLAATPVGVQKNATSKLTRSG